MIPLLIALASLGVAVKTRHDLARLREELVQPKPEPAKPGQASYARARPTAIGPYDPETGKPLPGKFDNGKSDGWMMARFKESLQEAGYLRPTSLITSDSAESNSSWPPVRQRIWGTPVHLITPECPGIRPRRPGPEERQRALKKLYERFSVLMCQLPFEVRSYGLEGEHYATLLDRAYWQRLGLGNPMHCTSLPGKRVIVLTLYDRIHIMECLNATHFHHHYRDRDGEVHCCVVTEKPDTTDPWLLVNFLNQAQSALHHSWLNP